MEIKINKNINDLKLKETPTIIYLYMDNNKKTIDCYYNDEIPLPLNLLKIFTKKHPNIQKKKFFDMFEDILFVYDRKKPINDFEILFKLK